MAVNRNYNVIIQELKINHLRNLVSVDIQPSPGINLFYGSNGSGKTSLIEGAYLLGRGKTFREARQDNLIQDGQQQVVVFASLLGPKRQTIGFIKKRKGAEISINGKRENRISKLAEHFPVSIITPKSHEIIESGPEYRRRFLDWSVFHVEPSYKGVISSYLKLVRERNHLLKNNHTLLPHWESSLEKQALIINDLRISYLDKLKLYVDNILVNFNDIPKIELIYQQGSDPTQPLSEVLQQRRQEDILRGYTSVGPHRADLKIAANKRVAKARLSRGQQKIVIIALVLAQIRLLRELTDKTSLLLIDDLAAELDEKNREILIALVRDFRIQTFITATSKDLIKVANDEKVFHVEQGSVF